MRPVPAEMHCSDTNTPVTEICSHFQAFQTIWVDLCDQVTGKSDYIHLEPDMNKQGYIRF